MIGINDLAFALCQIVFPTQLSGFTLPINPKYEETYREASTCLAEICVLIQYSIIAQMHLLNKRYQVISFRRSLEI